MLEAVASSLTEMFAPAILTDHVSLLDLLSTMPSPMTEHWPIPPAADEGTAEVAFGLSWVNPIMRTLEKQNAAAASATPDRCPLWSQLDALSSAYVTPAVPPLGAWDGREAVVCISGGACFRREWSTDVPSKIDASMGDKLPRRQAPGDSFASRCCYSYAPEQTPALR